MSDIKPRIGVAGAGPAGRCITLAFAAAGYDVLVSGKNLAELERALDYWNEVLETGNQGQSQCLAGKEVILNRIAFSLQLSDFSEVDFLFDTVIDTRQNKARSYLELGRTLRDDCVIVSATKVTHSFDLGAQIPLRFRANFVVVANLSSVVQPDVFVVPHPLTSGATLRAVEKIFSDLGRRPIRVSEHWGMPAFVKDEATLVKLCA